ncbi:MAG TPA: cadmium resistance transporter [Cyclobacteriaceae bacterium]|nr:cadmium resistance transporter [Cyclobacteriaceae bacterium]
MQIVITSLLAFISTNVDDIFILMLFYGSRKFRPSTIILGQYLGIATLIVISLIGSYVGNFLDQRFIGLLGLFPIYLGIKKFFDKEEDASIETKSSGIVAIAGVTIANGGDNIGVYTPLFTTMTAAEQIQMIVIFGVMTWFWCLAGKYLSSRPIIARQIDRYGHVAMPIVLILLGIFILFESNSFTLIA